MSDPQRAAKRNSYRYGDRPGWSIWLLSISAIFIAILLNRNHLNLELNPFEVNTLIVVCSLLLIGSIYELVAAKFSAPVISLTDTAIQVPDGWFRKETRTILYADIRSITEFLGDEGQYYVKLELDETSYFLWDFCLSSNKEYMEIVAILGTKVPKAELITS